MAYVNANVNVNVTANVNANANIYVNPNVNSTNIPDANSNAIAGQCDLLTEECKKGMAEKVLCTNNKGYEGHC